MLGKFRVKKLDSPFAPRVLGVLAALLVSLAFGPRGVAQAGAISQSMSGMSLYINILEGEDALNNIRDRTAREPIVQVTDENHKPVRGAAVSFTNVAGASGAGAAFGAMLTYTTVTDEEGKAIGRGFQPNQIVGKYQIKVVATAGMMAAVIMIHETNLIKAVGGVGSAGGASAGGLLASVAAKLAVVGVAVTGTSIGLYQSFMGADAPTALAQTPTPTVPATVPEIDPRMAFGCLILLAGGVAVLRGR